VDEAITHFQKALEILPSNVIVRNNLGYALLQKGQIDAAIVHFQKSLEFQPGDAKAHNDLGYALLQNGREDEALAHFQKALEIQPRDAPGHNNLANALLRKGRVREAVAHYQTALELRPNNVRTLSNLAWVLATWPEASIRNGAQAIELAQRASQLTDGQDPMILRTLAAAYAEGGRFAEAITNAQHALQLADARSNSTLADTLQSQLMLYQAGSPFRDTVPAPQPVK
jgi:Flp pilus assembly protein TadD